MAATSFEHSNAARAALQAIVTDPEHGPDALDNRQTVANLLEDLLPDAPRESGLLIAAVGAGLPGRLRNDVGHGMDPATAVSLAAAILESRTAFTTEACWWAASEIAFALGLAHAETVPAMPPVTQTELARSLSHQAPDATADVTQTALPPGHRSVQQPTGATPPGRPRPRVGLVAVVGICILAAAGIVSAAILLTSHKSPSGQANAGNSRHRSASGYANVATLNPGTQRSMTSIAWTPDSSIVATGDKDGNSYLWDPQTGQQHGPPFTIAAAGEVYAIAISPDGSTLAAGYSNGSTYLWGIASRKLIATLRDPGHAASRQVDSVAFSPDGQLLVSADGSGNAYLWRITPGHQSLVPVMTLPDPAGAGVWSAVFSSRGMLATGDYRGNVYLWNTSSGSYSGRFVVPGGEAVSALAFSPDGRVLAAGSGSVSTDTGSMYLFDVGSQTSKFISSGGSVWALAFAGDKLAAAVGNGETYLWDVNVADLAASSGGTLTDPHTGALGVGAVGFSPDRKWLVTGDTNGLAYVWRTS